MAYSTARLEVPCKNERCKNIIAIDQNWIAGGPNDCGGFIVECIKCGLILDVYVGEDVDASTLVNGGIYLDNYYCDIERDRNAVRAKFGLGPLDDTV